MVRAWLRRGGFFHQTQVYNESMIVVCMLTVCMIVLWIFVSGTIIAMVCLPGHPGAHD